MRSIITLLAIGVLTATAAGATLEPAAPSTQPSTAGGAVWVELPDEQVVNLAGACRASRGEDGAVKLEFSFGGQAVDVIKPRSAVIWQQLLKEAERGADSSWFRLTDTVVVNLRRTLLATRGPDGLLIWGADGNAPVVNDPKAIEATWKRLAKRLSDGDPKRDGLVRLGDNLMIDPAALERVQKDGKNLVLSFTTLSYTVEPPDAEPAWQAIKGLGNESKQGKPGGAAK
jgi:hypothetical protein